jgi:hypothetical protein
MDSLYNYCMMTEDQLIGDPDAAYRFIDNGSNVLAVAHVDTVAKGDHNYSVDDKQTVTSIALDDRLGAWIIMELLPHLGVLPDVLLTRDEEIGRSTAQFFKSEKDYNWIFSFDRHGKDVVMYDYENDASAKLLTDYGFHVGVGSFSDICYLDHIGVIGFNFGTCYYNEHSPACHANMSDVVEQVEKFVVFYLENEATSMPYDPATMGYSSYTTGRYSRYGYNAKDYLYDWDAPVDGEKYAWAGKCIVCDLDMMEYEVSSMDEAICCYCAEAIEDGAEIRIGEHPTDYYDEYMELLDNQFDHYMSSEDAKALKARFSDRRKKK